MFSKIILFSLLVSAPSAFSQESKSAPVKITVYNVVKGIDVIPLRLMDKDWKDIASVSLCPIHEGYISEGINCISTNDGSTAQFENGLDKEVIEKILLTASYQNPVTITFDPKTHHIIKVKSPSMGNHSFVPSASRESSKDNKPTSHQ